jgi:hypothetical protein
MGMRSPPPSTPYRLTDVLFNIRKHYAPERANAKWERAKDEEKPNLKWGHVVVNKRPWNLCVTKEERGCGTAKLHHEK